VTLLRHGKKAAQISPLSIGPHQHAAREMAVGLLKMALIAAHTKPDSQAAGGARMADQCADAQSLRSLPAAIGFLDGGLGMVTDAALLWTFVTTR
jgi:hypothetical protein